MSETRRSAIRFLGTVGATCAFPFAADELYGQHAHVALTQATDASPYRPAFFTPAEYATVSRLADAIIPETTTPGATAAGVPEYIDRVVASNQDHHALARAGLGWLDRQARARFGTEFAALAESQQAALLRPLSDEVDRQLRDAQSRRFQADASGGRVYYVPLTDKTPPPPPQPDDERTMPARFFRLIKNLTADGYYTSRVGLLDELGYSGNTFLAAFPGCGVKEQ